MEITLVMFKADGSRKDFPLIKPKVVVGRKNTCDLRIPLPSVSRQHFAIEREGETVTLRDLGSSNGTFYNDERVMEAELSAGDQVKVGPVTFVVVIDGEPAEIDPVRTVLDGAGERAGERAGEAEAPLDASALEADLGASDTGEAMAASLLSDDDDDDDFEVMAMLNDEDDDDDPLSALDALEGEPGDSGIPMLEDDDDTK